MKRLLIVLGLTAGLALAGCGGDGAERDGGTEDGTSIVENEEGEGGEEGEGDDGGEGGEEDDG